MHSMNLVYTTTLQPPAAPSKALRDSVWAPTPCDPVFGVDPPTTDSLVHGLPLPDLQHAVAHFDSLSQVTYRPMPNFPPPPVGPSPSPVDGSLPAPAGDQYPRAALGVVCPTWILTIPPPTLPTARVTKDVSLAPGRSQGSPSPRGLPSPWSQPPPPHVPALNSMPRLVTPPTQRQHSNGPDSRPRNKQCKPVSDRARGRAPGRGQGSHTPSPTSPLTPQPQTTRTSLLDSALAADWGEDSAFLDLDELVMPYKVPGLLLRRTTDLEPCLVPMSDDEED